MVLGELMNRAILMNAKLTEIGRKVTENSLKLKENGDKLTRLEDQMTVMKRNLQETIRGEMADRIRLPVQAARRRRRN